MSKSDELTLIRTDTFENVPRKLFEDSADELLDKEIIDRIYLYNQAFKQDPLTMIYELRDKDGKVQGVLWLVVNVILEALDGKFVAVSPEYRDGTVLKKLTDFAEHLARELGLKKIFAASQKDTAFWQSFGWREMKTRTLVREV